MIEPNKGIYTIPEPFMDGVLIHQKDRILSWLNDLERCRSRDKFLQLKSQVLGAIIILADLWAVFGYSYKADEITERIKKIRTNHEFKDLWN